MHVRHVDGDPGKLGVALHAVGTYAGPATALKLTHGPVETIARARDTTTATWLYLVEEAGLSVYRATAPGTWHSVVTKVPWDAAHARRLHEAGD